MNFREIFKNINIFRDKKYGETDVYFICQLVLHGHVSFRVINKFFLSKVYVKRVHIDTITPY